MVSEVCGLHAFDSYAMCLLQKTCIRRWFDIPKSIDAVYIVFSRSVTHIVYNVCVCAILRGNHFDS